MIPTLLATIAMSSAQTPGAIVRIPALPAFVSDHELTTMCEPVTTDFPWNEAIVSWNVENPGRAFLKIEAQVVYQFRSSNWYTLAEWTGDLSAGPRQSVANQTNVDGEMLTDTLRLTSPTHTIRLRVTERQIAGGEPPKLKLLALCLSNTAAIHTPGEPYKAAWGKLLAVPQRSQMAYEHGKLNYDSSRVSKNFEDWFKNVKTEQYCSPTSSSMALDYWSTQLNRTELNVDVPDVVAGVFDEKYPGTGNWTFNTAYMGSFQGIRSYVTRLRSLSDLEHLIEAGVPVVCSVAYNLLQGNGKPPGGDGHLVVLVGFTPEGDPVFNDPGRTEVRQIYKRANFKSAWENSNRTVYIVHPETLRLPEALKGVVLTD